MRRYAVARRASVLAALAAGAIACTPDADIVRPPEPLGGTMFRSYVNGARSSDWIVYDEDGRVARLK